MGKRSSPTSPARPEVQLNGIPKRDISITEITGTTERFSTLEAYSNPPHLFFGFLISPSLQNAKSKKGLIVEVVEDGPVLSCCPHISHISHISRISFETPRTS
jgi:hypothetical protein